MFLEAHEYAFGYFGGVFRTLRYDNLKAAVKKILRGSRREETVRFIAFRSHWRFASEFCTPEEPQEKGGVEGEVGYFRRNHWVPLPQARDLEDLNAQLLAACHADEQRQIAGQNQAVGMAALAERAHLLPLTEQAFELAEVCFPRVDGLGWESEALLTELTTHATQRQFVYSHRWREGDLVMWDNRCLLHRAFNDYDMSNHARVLHRTVVRGTVPV